jgi:hypothetical protein
MHNLERWSSSTRIRANLLCARKGREQCAQRQYRKWQHLGYRHDERSKAGRCLAMLVYILRRRTRKVNMTSGCTCIATGYRHHVNLHVIYMSGTRIKFEEVRTIDSFIPHLGKLPGYGLVSADHPALHLPCQDVASGFIPDSLTETTPHSL